MCQIRRRTRRHFPRPNSCLKVEEMHSLAVSHPSLDRNRSAMTNCVTNRSVSCLADGRCSPRSDESQGCRPPSRYRLPATLTVQSTPRLTSRIPVATRASSPHAPPNTVSMRRERNDISLRGQASKPTGLSAAIRSRAPHPGSSSFFHKRLRGLWSSLFVISAMAFPTDELFKEGCRRRSV